MNNHNEKEFIRAGIYQEAHERERRRREEMNRKKEESEHVKSSDYFYEGQSVFS